MNKFLVLVKQQNQMELPPSFLNLPLPLMFTPFQIREQWACGRALEDKSKGFGFNSTYVQNLKRSLVQLNQEIGKIITRCLIFKDCKSLKISKYKNPDKDLEKIFIAFIIINKKQRSLKDCIKIFKDLYL